MTPAADPAGRRPEARLPLATWPSFQAALVQLRGCLPSDRPVDMAKLGPSPSTRKQVAAALRALGLVTSSDLADFGLRRLVANDDYSIVVAALEERFPEPCAAAKRRAGRQEITQIIEGYGAPASSNDRFWRFVRGAYAAAHGGDLPKITFGRGSAASSSAGRVATVASARAVQPRNELKGLIGSKDDSVARRLLEAEACSYERALEAALAQPDLAAASTISDRLRKLREELRRPLDGA